MIIARNVSNVSTFRIRIRAKYNSRFKKVHIDNVVLRGYGAASGSLASASLLEEDEEMDNIFDHRDDGISIDIDDENEDMDI